MYKGMIILFIRAGGDNVGKGVFNFFFIFELLSCIRSFIYVGIK